MKPSARLRTSEMHDMDLLDCETRSRCATCHHWTATGCRLLESLALYEASIAPAPTRDVAPALALYDHRIAAGPVAEA